MFELFQFLSTLSFVILAIALFKPQFFKLDSKKEVIKSILPITIVLFLIAFVLEPADYSEQISKKDSVKQESTVQKPEKQVDNRPKSERLSQEQKSQLESFYKDLVSVGGAYDKGYSEWQSSLGKKSAIDSYAEGDLIKKASEVAAQKVYDINIPEIDGVDKDDVSKLRNAKADLSSAYMSRSRAVEAIQDFLNTQDMKSYSRGSEEIEMYQSKVISSVASIMSVLSDYGVNIPETSK